jgi:hypothetical protein
MKFIDIPSEPQTSHIYGESAGTQFYLFVGQGASRTNIISTRERSGLVLRKKDDTDVYN